MTRQADVVDDGPEPRRRPQYDTGLILALPALAGFTSRWRSTSYAPDHPTLPIERRFPPHVTLLAPWALVDDTEALQRLQQVAGRGQPLRLEFAAADLFPDSGVVWLAPTPSSALESLFHDVIATFPDHPPYGGLHDEVVPHLTVSANGGPAVLAEVRAAIAEHGAVHAQVDRICVFARGEDDVWRRSASVALGSGEVLTHRVQRPQPDAIA